MASDTEQRSSNTQSFTTRVIRRSSEDQENWTTLVLNKEIVLDRKTSLLNNFSFPKPPDEQHAVYYEYEENVSASNEQRMYEDDRCIRLLRLQDPAKEDPSIPSDIAKAIASGPAPGAALKVAYAKHSSYHEYSKEH